MSKDDDMFNGATFVKAKASMGAGACVEVARSANSVALRDSKDRSGPVLVFNRNEWNAFKDGVTKGEFDV